MIEITEDGYITVGITAYVGEAAVETRVEKRLDLYAVNNHLWQIQDETQGKSLEECGAALLKYLEELGFPPCSVRVAVQFKKKITELIEELRKKDSASEKQD